MVCPKHFLIPSLVSRHVSRPAQYIQHFVLFFIFLYFSFFQQLRLKVDHVQNTLRRFFTIEVTVLRIQNLVHIAQATTVLTSVASLQRVVLDLVKLT